MTGTPSPISARCLKAANDVAAGTVHTGELKNLLREAGAALISRDAEIAAAHAELDALDVQHTSLGGPFGDSKYHELKLNIIGRIRCLGQRTAE